MTLPDGTVKQVNLYFNEFTADHDNLNCLKTTGFFSTDPIGGKKRASALKLPMAASCEIMSDGTYELIILAMYQIPPELGSGLTVAEFRGTAVMGGPGVTDDSITGTWYIEQDDEDIVSGPWSAEHLDRNRVNAPSIALSNLTEIAPLLLDMGKGSGHSHEMVKPMMLLQHLGRMFESLLQFQLLPCGTYSGLGGRQ